MKTQISILWLVAAASVAAQTLPNPLARSLMSTEVTTTAAANKIPRLGSDGKFDLSLIPTESLQIIARSGTDAERQTVVFANGELAWSTDTKQLYVGDGTTLGGVSPLAFRRVNGNPESMAFSAEKERYAVEVPSYSLPTRAVVVDMDNGLPASGGDWFDPLVAAADPIGVGAMDLQVGRGLAGRVAAAPFSVALGFNNRIAHEGWGTGVAIGTNNTATNGGVAIGDGAFAGGGVALGGGRAYSSSSVAVGGGSHAYGAGAFAGNGSALGDFSAVFGDGTSVDSYLMSVGSGRRGQVLSGVLGAGNVITFSADPRISFVVGDIVAIYRRSTEAYSSGIATEVVALVGSASVTAATDASLTVSSDFGMEAGTDVQCFRVSTVPGYSSRAVRTNSLRWSVGADTVGSTSNQLSSIGEPGVTQATMAAYVRIRLNRSETWVVDLDVVAANESNATEAAAFRRRFVIACSATGTCALVGSVQTLGTDITVAGSSTWSVAISANDTYDSLSITVTGQSGKTVRWAGTVSATILSPDF